MVRIVSRDDLKKDTLGEAYEIIDEYLNEALYRFDVFSFAPFGSFYYLDHAPSLEDCYRMGFNEILAKLEYQYTDEIHIMRNYQEKILLNPTFIFDNDYVVSIFVFQNDLDEDTRQNIRKYIDVKTTKQYA